MVRMNISHIVYLLVMIYFWLIVARAVLSWFRPGPGTFVFRRDRVLFKLTEPYIAIFRQVVPTGRAGSIGIDWSYTVALLVLFIVQLCELLDVDIFCLVPQRRRSTGAAALQALHTESSLGRHLPSPSSASQGGW